MVKVARKSPHPKVRTLATVIDEMAVLRPDFAAIKKKMDLLEQELKDFLGDDIMKDGIIPGDLYALVLKRSDPDPLFIDNDKVLALVDAATYEKLKSPRPTVRKTFIKRSH